MGAQSQSQIGRKIHFILQKHLNFGRAVYVLGNIKALGGWEVEKGCKLSWSKDDYWTGFITVSQQELQNQIEFKYVIGNWDHPQQGQLDWEAGKMNRKIEVGRHMNHIICENTWNMERITLNLLVPEEGKNQEYQVIGNCKQLGSWKKSYSLTYCKKKNNAQLEQIKILDERSKYSAHSFSFEIFRDKPKIHYYYIKRGSGCQIERHPGRKYQLDTGMSSHPKCLKIGHQKGDTQLYEICNFTQLNYSKVTQNILLGPYLRTLEDFQILKKQGVSSILSIQTDQDLAMHQLTQGYLHEQSKRTDLQLFNYAIQDMDKVDFISKCRGAIEHLKRLVEVGKKVYVHCSAGVYRSPQIVALFLILTKNYSLEGAVQFVKSRHPFARPNTQLVSHALQMFSKNNTQSVTFEI